MRSIIHNLILMVLRGHVNGLGQWDSGAVVFYIETQGLYPLQNPS